MRLKDLPLLSPFYFHPLTPEETFRLFPQYFREACPCFLILKETVSLGQEESTDWDPVGLYGLIDRGVDPETGDHLGEGFLTVFPKFRFRVLNKTFFKALFDHAFTTGFQKVYTWTRWKSWATVLQRFASLGITHLESPPPWDTDPTKSWFVKEQPHDQDHDQDQQLLKKKDPKKGGYRHVFRW